MEFSKTIEPVTALKTKSAELIRKARESGQPIIITQNGRATAVLQDVESYEQMRKALHLLQLLASGDRQLGAGEGLTQKQAERRIQDLLNDMDKK